MFIELSPDDNFVESKKQKMSLEIQQVQEAIEHQRQRSDLELKLLKAQISELESRNILFQSLTSILKQQPLDIFKWFKNSEP